MLPSAPIIACHEILRWVSRQLHCSGNQIMQCFHFQTQFWQSECFMAEKPSLEFSELVFSKSLAAEKYSISLNESQEATFMSYRSVSFQHNYRCGFCRLIVNNNDFGSMHVEWSHHVLLTLASFENRVMCKMQHIDEKLMLRWGALQIGGIRLLLFRSDADSLMLLLSDYKSKEYLLMKVWHLRWYFSNQWRY